jgi:two-component system nitrate/nitrite response regulator NarL
MSLRLPTVLLVPDPVIRAGLSLVIGQYRYEVVAASADIDELAASGPRQDIGMVLIGSNDPDYVARQLEQARLRWPTSKIVIFGDGPATFDGLADGWMPTAVSRGTLIRVLNLIVAEPVGVVAVAIGTHASGSRRRAPSESPPRGRNSHSAMAEGGAASQRDRRDHSPKLSPRELSVLDGVAKGLRNRAIAAACGITEETVKVHIRSILKKIGVANRIQAAVWAVEHGVLRPDETER